MTLKHTLYFALVLSFMSEASLNQVTEKASVNDGPVKYAPPVVTLYPRQHSLVVRVEGDQQLKKEYGDQLEYRFSYKEENAKEPWMRHSDHLSHVTIEHLKPGRGYCVKVEYLKYLTANHMMPFTERCAVIPELESTIGTTGVAVLVLIVVGGAATVTLTYLCGIKRCHQKLKEEMQVPIRPPDHLRKFLASVEFTQQPQETFCQLTSEPDEPCDRISVVKFDVAQILHSEVS